MNHLFKVSILVTLLSLFFISCFKQEEITLVQRGRTAYAIYLDESAPGSVRTAAEDLQSYFRKVSGASPEIVIAARPPSSHLISLGDNAAAKAAGVSASDIPTDGFRMVTREGNIYILGPDTPDGEVNTKGGVNKGTSNGVYTFIEDYLGVKWLMPGEIGEEYDEVKTISIPVLERMEYSPFDYRVTRGGGEWERYMKLGKVTPMEHGHSWIQTVPASLYEKHPEWFAMRNGRRVPPVEQYKLETTNPELVQYFADRVMETFRNEPDRRWYSLSPSDSWGWSESPESMALTETEPLTGQIAVTGLILSFYNDVARIVGKEFPDHMLGGYIYGNYRYPPSREMKIEPNLAFNIPNGPAYGFRLYRTSAMENWASGEPHTRPLYIPEWSELSKKYGFDLYYYDLPITIVQSVGLILPPAPDILNVTFSGIAKYGFKGAYISGNSIWPVAGPGNYAIAKLFWNPDLDAHDIIQDYCHAAYGRKAGDYMLQLFSFLDSAFSSYYNRNERVGWSLTEDHLEGIYAPAYPGMEQFYLKALPVKKKPRQQERLELFGDVLSLLNWNLRDHGFLPEDYTSPLTFSDEEIDRLLANQRDDCRIARGTGFSPGNWKVEKKPALPDAGTQKASIIPAYIRRMDVLLHVPVDGKVSITLDSLNKRAEFLQFILTDANGTTLQSGVASEGRTIRFDGKAGQNYYYRIPCRSASTRLKVEGASTAYHFSSGGFSIDGAYMEGPLPLYFYVPEGVGSFTMTMGGGNATADVYSPDGRNVGRLNTRNDPASLISIPGNDTGEGFYKIVLQKFTGRITISPDEQLPRWFFPDPANPLKIGPK